MENLYAIEAAREAMPIVAALINKDTFAYEFIVDDIGRHNKAGTYVIGLAAFAAILIHSIAELTEEDAQSVIQEWALMLSSENI